MFVSIVESITADLGVMSDLRVKRYINQFIVFASLVDYFMTQFYKYGVRCGAKQSLCADLFMICYFLSGLTFNYYSLVRQDQ